MPDISPTTDVVSPAGEYGNVPIGALPSYQALGYTIPTAEDSKQEDLRVKYGEGTKNQAETFGENLVNSVPFLGGPILKGLGVDNEQMQQHQKYFPLTSLTGTAAGLAGQAMIPMGPLAEMGKAGEAVSDLGIGEALTGNTLLKDIANKSLGSATEGALFGAGNAFNEATLGDPHMTAQSALSEIGTSSLLFGAGGALFGLAKPTKALIDAAKDTTAFKALKIASAIAHPLAAAANWAKGPILEALKEAIPEGLGDEVMDNLQKYTVFRPIEDLANRATKTVDRGIKGIFEDNNPEKIPITDIDPYKLEEDRQKLFDERTAKISSYSANPQTLIDKLSKSTDYLYPHAPQLITGVNATGMRAVNFLASKIPKQTLASPLAKSIIPVNDIAKFNRYYNAVDKPTDVLTDIKNGRISPESAEAVKSVYPELYQNMSNKLLDEVSHRGRNIPYQKRQSIGKFLGVDLDGNPNGTLANQTTFASPSQQKDNQGLGMGKSTQKGLSNVNVAQRYMTPMQQANRRSEEQ